MAVKKQKQIKVTLIKSLIGRLEAHRSSVRGLGLRKQRHHVLVSDTPENRGMIAKVRYLLKVEEV